MSKFRSIIDEKNRTVIESPTGNKITVVKGWVYENGDYVYKEKKLHNHYEETQAARDAVDLEAILARYNAGDADAINQVTGFYADIVDLPKTYGEMFDAVSNATNIFDALPADMRDHFGNNPAAFWKEYGTKDFDTFVNDYRSMFVGVTEPVTTIKEQVNESEVNIDVEKSE